MRIKFFCALLILSVSLRAQTLLTDDFSGESVDSAKWQTLLPYEESAINVNSGMVTLTNRGGLLSQSSFTGAINISGALTLNDNDEQFNIMTRTDGSIPSGNTYAERTGILFTFFNDLNLIRITQFNADGSDSALATASYTLTTGQSYNFSIALDGSNLSLSINGVLQLSAVSSYATGNKIGFYSRDYDSNSTSLDSVTVTSIPEPGTDGLLGAGVLLLAVRRRWPVRIVEIN